MTDSKIPCDECPSINNIEAQKIRSDTIKYIFDQVVKVATIAGPIIIIYLQLTHGVKLDTIETNAVKSADNTAEVRTVLDASRTERNQQFTAVVDAISNSPTPTHSFPKSNQ